MQPVNPSRGLAVWDFYAARSRANLQTFLAQLSGRSADLLAYDQVAHLIPVQGRSDRGQQAIPVAAIVGSVGRYQDFTRTFLPRLAASRDRYVGVKTAAPDVSGLPPIEVYQIGATYFVRDGHHRVAVARQQGLTFIDAHVIEVRTPVELSPDDDLEDLLVKAEHAAFMTRTRLDRLRPEADLRVSVPGQYDHLENHIEAFRYLTEERLARTLTDEEAVTGWYDEAYWPLVAALRQHGLLRYFPGRTEADFYVWLAAHRAALQNELGWAISPEVAVTRLAPAADPPRQPRSRPWSRRVLELVPGLRPPRPPAGRWVDEKRLARYSDRLLADILVVLPGSVRDRGDLAASVALNQALFVARREGSQVIAVQPGLEAGSTGSDRRREAFAAYCQAQGVTGVLARPAGTLEEALRDRAGLTDLVVTGRQMFSGVDGAGPKNWLALSNRPLLVAVDPARPLRHVLLLLDGGERAREGLFVAAYLGEQWGSAVTVLLQADKKRQAEAERYLALHEVQATFQPAPGAGTADILALLRGLDGDLLIFGGDDGRRWGRSGAGSRVSQLVSATDRPSLILP